MDKHINEKLDALLKELAEHKPTAYRVGTVRTWKSGKFKKTATGWVPVSSMMKSVANKPKGATSPQDLKHASFGKVTHSTGVFIRTPGIVTYVPPKGSAAATPTAKLTKGSTPSYSHQSKASGHGAYATPTPSQSAPPSSDPGGVLAKMKGIEKSLNAVLYKAHAKELAATDAEQRAKPPQFAHEKDSKSAMPHFGGTMPHHYEYGKCVYCGKGKPKNEAFEGDPSRFSGVFRRLTRLSDDRVLNDELSLGLDEADLPTVSKYDENPEAYNAQLAKLMMQLKRDKNSGVTGIRQGYKGTGTKSHKRQVWVKMPEHERGGPDVWLDSGFVKVGGIIDIPKSIPNSKKYGDESPEAVYRWIADTMKALKKWTDDKYAQSPAVAKEASEISDPEPGPAKYGKLPVGMKKNEPSVGKAMPWPTNGKQSKPKSTMEALDALLSEMAGKVADMDDEEVIKCAHDLAKKAHNGRLSSAEQKNFKAAMQRIKDEGMLSDDDVKDIWKWHGGGGQ